MSDDTENRQPPQSNPESPMDNGSSPSAHVNDEERARRDASQPATSPIVAMSPEGAEPPNYGPAGERIEIVTRAASSRMGRRELLKLVPLLGLGAFAIPELRNPLFDEGVRFADWASGTLFGRHRLAQTYSDSEIISFDRFPYNGYDVLDPEVDFGKWTLTVQGLVARPGEYSLAQLQAFPKVVQNTRHVCVEGWDAIGNFGGTRISDFLRSVGADLNARYLEVKCVDDYYESIDMASAMHPQSLLCYEMYGKPLDRGHGAPLRLQMPTKLGYKQAKYLDTIRVTNVLQVGKRGYWEDQGYSWFGGL